MLDRILAPEPFQAAQGALDGLSARHSAIADNIANVNTPGYKRKDVQFEAALADSLSKTTATGGPIHFAPVTTRDSSTSLRPDGNNVDIERESVALAENALRYETLTEYVGTFFTNLKSVIKGG